MRNKNIRHNMFLNIGVPCIAGYVLVFILLHFVIVDQSSMWSSESEKGFIEKYRLELKSTTELAAGLLETVYSIPEISDEEKLSLAKTLIRPLRFDTDGYFYVYEKGTGKNVIHAENQSLEGKNLWNLQDPDKTQYIIRELDKVAQENSLYHNFYWKKPGTEGLSPKLGTAAVVPGTDLWVGTGVYIDDMEKELLSIESQIKKRTNRLEAVIFSIFLIIAVLSLSLLAALSNNLARPVIDLRNLLKETGGNDFSHRGIYKEKRKSREIQELYDAINLIFDEVSTVISFTKENTASALELSQQLAEISTASSYNVGEVNGKLIELSKESEVLQVEIGESARTTKDFQNFISSVDSLILKQVAALEESSTAVEQMIGSIADLAESTEERSILAEKLAETSRKGREEMNASISNIQIITQSTEDIGGMIMTINDLAEQTNLLAMNAAIEAARAGASGSGFAVIAQEIRNLSVNSSRNVRIIAESLQSITNQIKESEKRTITSGNYFTAMADGIHDVSHGFRLTQSATQSIAAGGHQLNESISDLRMMGSQISQSSGETKKQIDEISKTFDSIESIAIKTNNELGDAANDLSSITDNMTVLAESGTENEKSMTMLKKNLAVFKLG